MQSARDIVEDLIHGRVDQAKPHLLGLSPQEASSTPADMPQSIDELNQQQSHTYDLSLTAAAQLNIPVIGSVSGDYSRRVVVLERTAFKAVPDTNGRTHQYGYAIRLAITVSKLASEMKATLPFLAASAEVGQIEAKWVLQVVGLAGPTMDSAAIPPTELNVETFVLAKQSLTALIGAVRDSATTFRPELLSTVQKDESSDAVFTVALGRAYALASISKRRKLQDALRLLAHDRASLRDAISDAYRILAGAENEGDVPSEAAKEHARNLLGDIRIEPR